MRLENDLWLHPQGSLPLPLVGAGGDGPRGDPVGEAMDDIFSCFPLE